MMQLLATQPSAHGLTRRQRWLPLMVVCLGLLMIVRDVTIVNVALHIALPSIKADLGFTETSPCSASRICAAMCGLLNSGSSDFSGSAHFHQPQGAIA